MDENKHFEYALIYNACYKVKEAKRAITDCFIHNRKFSKYGEPFEAVERLVETVAALEEYMDYTRRQWETNNNQK